MLGGGSGDEITRLGQQTLYLLQSKIHAARSLSEIAIDLTETGTLKTSKLANMGSKGKIISGSSGSLLSSGQCTVSVCVCVF